MRNVFFIGLLFIIGQSSADAWGHNTHKFVNKNAVIHLPASMYALSAQVGFLEIHAPDPDGRGGLRHLDTNLYGEYWRHFLDIDNYPDFKNLSPDLFKLIELYGRDVVRKNGTAWWATVWVMDSLTAQLKRGDSLTAYQTAADLGHYVADMHQPLHATINFNGYQTGNTGIHSRYETTMMNAYLSTISVTKDTVMYIQDPMSYVLSYILTSNSYADSVIAADRYAAPPTGYNGTGTLPVDYYAKLWERSQGYTKTQIQRATIALANLWYTAYVNAGLLNQTNVRKDPHQVPSEFRLRQNYPNPFNPATKIEFDIPHQVHTKLEIFSVDGKLVEVLVNASLDKGSYFAVWDAHHAPSGLYFYRLTAGTFSQSKKLVIVK
jgi:hypothetical protein